MAQGQVEPSAFSMAGGPVGCLLVHGFSGAPAEMRPLGSYLQARGLTISAPLLAGHGTNPEDLNRVRWRDWLGSAEQVLRELLATCEQVFIAGLSMGALITIHLAIKYPETAGIALYSPALKAANKLAFLTPLARYVVRQFPKPAPDDLTDPDAADRIWQYPTYPVGGASELGRLQRYVRSELRDVRAPAIVFFSTRDTSIHPTSGKLVFEGLGSQDKELVILHNSGHCMTVDSERESIFARTYGFFLSQMAGRS